jgi:mono/diheme cytochrome c family protein
MTQSKWTRGWRGALLVGGLCAIAPAVYGQGIGLKKLDEMMTPSAAKQARGKLVWERNCVSCHGASGKNDTGMVGVVPGLEAGGFVDGYKHGGGLIQIYNLISTKQEVAHPVYPQVPYQDRWAVAHYARTLSRVQPSDPPAVVEGAKFEAIHGVCDPELKGGISARVQPKGDEQLTKGKELYASNCASCHGENGGGDGAAAAALNPPPRNFKSNDQKWVNGTSPLGIFKTLTNGIEGGSMASYANLTEDERWALVHYVRSWVPQARQEASTEEQITEVCRALSAPAKPAAIPVERAMAFMVEEAPAKRAMQRSKYGVVYLAQGADPVAGEQAYTANCASCHGVRGVGVKHQGPYGAIAPFLYLQVERLVPQAAGGTYEDFARRSAAGVHATLPNMSGAAMLSKQDWKNLQAYVASFEGEGEKTYTPDGLPVEPAPTPAAPTPATP